MELALSIESFPLSEETDRDMNNLLDGLGTDYRTVTGASVWRLPDVRGFAVLAYTEEGELKGFATAIDIVNLDQYEWSAVVSPDIRRQSVGAALAEGIRHGLKQRGAEGELAACVEEEGAAAFIQSLGYKPAFKEIQLAAPLLRDYELPSGMEVVLADEEEAEAERVLTAAFDENMLPVIAYNMADESRQVWLMRKDGRAVASAATLAEDGHLWVTAFGTHPDEQGKGYGKAFLHWCRQLAARMELRDVMLDVETENEALALYERSGFTPVTTVAYWEPESTG
ncbi:GNAT family N-acetyltransferase [Planococcus lenghuensis]|uniref:N-acetyltransferase domain-containing protein n=1 Tax=Planococcus lenghuensis TaxID=2213202 RepID=A0A1Q2L1N5_9BACL|nr:GNAT family N-acetyltransferase [Planococcus lenghuensis]AQQ54370.1 hypothetical protein B0X71_15520 [Planococcus lenghuensis]